MINNDIIGNHHKRQVHVLVADHLVYKHTDLHVEQLKTISKCGTSTPYWVVCSQLADNLCKRQFHAKHMFFLPTFIQIGLAKIAKNQGSNNEPPLYLLIKKSNLFTTTLTSVPVSSHPMQGSSGHLLPRNSFWMDSSWTRAWTCWSSTGGMAMEVWNLHLMGFSMDGWKPPKTWELPAFMMWICSFNFLGCGVYNCGHWK